MISKQNNIVVQILVAVPVIRRHPYYPLQVVLYHYLPLLEMGETAGKKRVKQLEKVGETQLEKK